MRGRIHKNSTPTPGNFKVSTLIPFLSLFISLQFDGRQIKPSFTLTHHTNPHNIPHIIASRSDIYIFIDFFFDCLSLEATVIPAFLTAVCQ